MGLSIASTAERRPIPLGAPWFGAPSDERPNSGGGQRVFIVDDQFTGRRILERIIQRLEAQPITEIFSDPLEALEAAVARVPDLVLTDYRMPKLDGIEFTRRFRELPGCGEVPLIMVTIVEDPHVRYTALDAGATDFLVRPIDQHECRARCRNLLTLRHQQKIIEDRALWLEVEVTLATQEIHARERETLLRLAKAGESRDKGTGNHVIRMAKYACIIAEALGLSAEACETLELAAPMHDIGKIGVPDNVLLKSGPLSPDEWNLMQAHTLIGYEILKDSASPYMQQGAIIALTHHENYDGTGYPKGLRGEEIPLIARIVAVADVYDALTSERSYKKAWPLGETLRHIQSQSGKRFDPKCVAALIARLDAILEIQAALQDQ